MGQGHSFPDPERIIKKLHSHIGTIKRIANLSYEDFLKSVVELNEITSSFSDQRGKQLKFNVQEGSDASVFWKSTVRICCKKILASRNQVLSTRLLNLKQFIEIYKEITDQVSALPQDSRERVDICASVIFERSTLNSLDDEEECCICMENKAEMILPCTHRFCEGCIQEWNVSSKTCPICRERVNSVEDTWVLTEKPDTQEYEKDVKGYLVSLADRKET